MGEFLTRLLEIVNELADGKPTVFAKKAEIPPSTFQYYVKGRMPHGDHLKRICEYYGVNINWLLTGKGQKYIKEEDRLEYSTDYEEVSLDESPKMMDLLNVTREILQSGTEYSEFLVANIRAFQNALLTEIRLNKMESEFAELKNMCSGLTDRTEQRHAMKDDKIRKNDSPEKKEELVNMRATSTG